MASTPEGAAYTEQQRQQQQAVRAAFLVEFLALWPLLDPARLDETGAAWVGAVMPVLARFREASARVATNYFLNYRAAELGTIIPTPAPSGSVVPQPVRLSTPSPPPAPRATVPADVKAARAVLREGARAEHRIATEQHRAARPATHRDNAPRDARHVAREVRRATLHLDESAFTPREPRKTVIDIPELDTGKADRAAKVSLIVTGPVNQKAKIARGKSPEQANREALAEASGAASRHVLTGGRQSLLTLVEGDMQALGWARVTDGDPCAFCAMLASRGPVYRTEVSAGFQAHDHCACTAEPVYSRQAPWPGRGAEFRRLYRQATQGYSGRDAINAFRRAYERQQRDRAGQVA